MSSLAAARADNFYYPPEWTPQQGSLNKFQGQHPLRERARKLDQGILIIRFEMPYNIWCGGCHSMIAKGVRFNAEKKQVGNYYSTKIWSFSMKAACCRQEIVIQTDPQNCEYVIISGAQKKTEEYDPDDAGTLMLSSDADKGKLADPFYRLEHLGEDAQRAKVAEPLLVRMQRVSKVKHENDYSLNRSLRARLREQKERVKAETDHSKKLGLGIRLLPPSKEDAEEASRTKFPHKFEANQKQKRAAIIASSIFSQESGKRNRAVAGSEEKLLLLAKRRRMDVAAAHRNLIGRCIAPLSKPRIGSLV
ncbi:hypothetical protein GOP47_0029848 [Adiantum capillus-veneris]|nr:hypothetical protein GOP47_0029848 [Adiantum capillus-veneris]